MACNAHADTLLGPGPISTRSPGLISLKSFVLIFIEAYLFLVVIKYDYCFRRLKVYKRKADMSRMHKDHLNDAIGRFL
jgi:hypothetical protein